MESYKVIDTHSHIFSPIGKNKYSFKDQLNILENCIKPFHRQEYLPSVKSYRKTIDRLKSRKDLLGLSPKSADEMHIFWMDEMKVEKAIIFSVFENGNETTRIAARKFPDRFIPFFYIDPLVGNIRAKIEQAVKEGFKGIKLLPHWEDKAYYYDDPRIESLFASAEEYNLPMVAHAGFTEPGQTQYVKYANPMHLDIPMLNHPKLVVIIPHIAYPWADEAVTVYIHHYPRIYIDISPLPHYSLGLNFPYSILRHVVDLIGTDALLFGLDHSPCFYPEAIEMISRFNFLSNSEKEKILYGNAKRLLDLLHIR